MDVPQGGGGMGWGQHGAHCHAQSKNSRAGNKEKKMESYCLSGVVFRDVY